MTRAAWQTSTLDLNFKVHFKVHNSTLIAETGSNENLYLSLCDQLDKRLFINIMINRFLENINLALYYIFNINNSQYFKKLTKSGTKSSIVHNLVTCYKSWRRRLVLLFTPQWILQGNNGNNESFAMSLSSRYFYSSESFELCWQEKKRNLPSKNSLSRNHNWLIQWLRLSSVSAFFSNLKIPLKPT